MVFSAIGFCIATIIHQNFHSHHNNTNGNDTQLGIHDDDIYIDLAHFDTIFNYGQGIMVFAFFGLESKFVFKPLLKWFDSIQALYHERGTENDGYDDPRLYHWTLKLASKIFSKLPTPERETVQLRFKTSEAEWQYPTNQPRKSYLNASFRRSTMM